MTHEKVLTIFILYTIYHRSIFVIFPQLIFFAVSFLPTGQIKCSSCDIKGDTQIVNNFGLKFILQRFEAMLLYN